MLSDDESRHFMRMSVDAKAKVIVGEGDDEQIYEATCVDLSASGLSLLIDREFAPATEMVVFIKSGGPVASLKALTKVVRCQRLDEGGFQLGCEITQML